MPSTRLAGHTLRNEGRVYDAPYAPEVPRG